MEGPNGAKLFGNVGVARSGVTITRFRVLIWLLHLIRSNRLLIIQDGYFKEVAAQSFVKYRVYGNGTHHVIIGLYRDSPAACEILPGRNVW